MRTFIIIIFLAAIVFPQDATKTEKNFPQDTTKTEDGISQDTINTEDNIVDIVFKDAFLYFENCGAFFVSPLYADTEEWLYAAGITGATLILITQDGNLAKVFGRDTYQSINNDFWDIPTMYGVVEYSNIISAGIYAAGLFTDNTKVKDTGRLLMETITVSGVTALFLRFVTGRMRPPYTSDHLAFEWFETGEPFHSFPSGHAVVGVAMSTILAEQIDTWWSRVFFYGAAGLSAYVRLYNNQHWFTDVLTGSLLGFGAGMFMLHREELRTGVLGDGKLTLLPTFNGMNLIYSF